MSADTHHSGVSAFSGLARAFWPPAVWLLGVGALYAVSLAADFSGNLMGEHLRGVGKEGGWRLFWCAKIPMAMVFLSLVGHGLILLLGRRVAPDGHFRSLVRDYRRLSAWSLAGLPLLGLLLAVHHQLPDPLIVLGFVYQIMLAWMGLALSRLVWQGRDCAWGDNVGGGEGFIIWGLALGMTAVFFCIALWTNQALSTAGDEVNYLVKAHKLAAKAGFLADNALDQEVIRSYYRGAWSPNLVSTQWSAPLWVALIMPAYAIAGHLGALLIPCLAGGLCLAGVYRLARRIGSGSRESLALAWILGVSPAFVLFTQHLYPEMIGAAGAACGLYLVLGMDRKPLAALAGLVVLAALLGAVKFRMLPLAAGLLLAGGIRFMQIRRTWWPLAAGGTLGLFALAAILLDLPGTASLKTIFMSGIRFFQTHDAVLLPMLTAASAMLFDQQFGLLFYAWWLLPAFAGAVFFWRDHRHAMISCLAVCLPVWLSVILWRWVQWDAGFTPPGRFLVMLLPILALWALPALACCGSRAWRAVLLLVAGGGLLGSLLLNALPMWRYHRRTSVNNLLEGLGDLGNSVVHRFFPSFINFRLEDMLPALVPVVLMVLMGLWLWRLRRKGSRTAGDGGRLADTALAVLLGCVILAGLVAAGRMIPTGGQEAESFKRHRALLYGDYYPLPVYLVLTGPGSSAEGRLVWGKGSSRLILLAKYQPVGKPSGAAPFFPVIGIKMDGNDHGRFEIKPGKTLYTLPLKLPAGVHVLKITLLKSHGRDQAILDRIMVR